MQRKIFVAILMLILLSLNASCWSSKSTGPQYLWQDKEEIAKVRQDQPSTYYKNKKSILHWAEKVTKQPIPLLTDKDALPPSGNKRDYMSLSIYYWPNPNTPTGLPYIKHDGLVNPEKNDLARYDAKRLETMVSYLRALALGYAVSGREDLAQHACAILDAWFINPQTSMHPNLEYAQMVPGKNSGQSSGIIETVNLIGMLDDLHMLEGSQAYTPERQKALQSWFGAYADWLHNSQHGQKENTAKNNHGVWYDAQLAAFYHFSGRDKLAKSVLQQVVKKRMEPQLAADGSFPLELARTRPMNYSLYILRAYLTLARLGDILGVNLYDAQTSKGVGLQTAIDFILPYVHGEKKLPKQDVAPWSSNSFLLMLYTANKHYMDKTYEK